MAETIVSNEVSLCLTNIAKTIDTVFKIKYAKWFFYRCTDYSWWKLSPATTKVVASNHTVVQSCTPRDCSAAAKAGGERNASNTPEYPEGFLLPGGLLAFTRVRREPRRGSRCTRVPFGSAVSIRCAARISWILVHRILNFSSFLLLPLCVSGLDVARGLETANCLTRGQTLCFDHRFISLTFLWSWFRGTKQSEFLFICPAAVSLNDSVDDDKEVCRKLSENFVFVARR